MTRRALSPRTVPGVVELLKQVGRFLVVGSVCAAIDLAAYLALANSGFGTHPAKAVAYVLGMVFGFFANKLWTFGSRRRTAAEPLSYALLYAATLAINVMVNGVALTQFRAALAEGATAYAYLTATGLTTVLNFLGLRLMTFAAGIREDAAERFPATAGEEPAPGVNPELLPHRLATELLTAEGTQGER